jgi:hypothetical protein
MDSAIVNELLGRKILHFVLGIRIVAMGRESLAIDIFKGATRDDAAGAGAEQGGKDYRHQQASPIDGPVCSKKSCRH